MANELTDPNVDQPPDWMKKQSGAKASWGNIDLSDLKPPRLKLLAGMSPEVMDGLPGAQPGAFWLTILNLPLGREVLGTMIFTHRSYVVWAPKTPGSEQKGPLAIASNANNWDIPNQTFEVRFPDNPKTYVWKLGRTVIETGANKFGSSQPDNPKSKPIATLTYDILWLIDLPNGQKQLCVFTTARTGVKPTEDLLSAASVIAVPYYFQRWKFGVKREQGPTGDPYFVVQFHFAGLIQDEAVGAELKKLHESYAASGFQTDLEPEEDGPKRRTEDLEDVPF